MDPPSYQALRQDIHEAVLKNFIRNNEKDARFLPRNTAENILLNVNLGKFFGSLSEHGIDAELLSRVPEDEKIRRVKSRNLHDLIVLVLFASCNIQAALSLTKKLILPDAAEWAKKNKVRNAQDPIGSLPLNRKDCEEIFASPGSPELVTIDQILSNQSCFCPILLLENAELNLEIAEGRRFPYLEERWIGEGSFGDVFAVKIAKGHFVDRNDNLNVKSNDNPIDLARKDYEISADMNKSEEREIMNFLMKIKTPNIVQIRGSLRSGLTNYSLFLELAMSDLEKYLNDRELRWTSPKAKSSLLRSAVGLAGGLAFLHGDIKGPNYEEYACYHLDLKPKNVLVFRQMTDSGEEQNVWKLSDFGHSVVKPKKRGHEDGRNTGRVAWFRQRRHDASFSGTENRRLQGTYLAPESETGLRNMGAHSDNWSLGCIISEVFACIEYGSDGIRNYRTMREEDRSRNQSDQFFRPATMGWQGAILSPQVVAKHRELIAAAAERSPLEKKAVERMLRYLEKDVLIPEWTSRRDRCSARFIQGELKAIADFYDNFNEEDAGEPQNDGIPSNSMFNWLRLQRLAFQHSALDTVESNRPSEALILPEASSIKESTISVNNTVIAFWTESQIRLYTPQLLTEQDNPRLKTRGYESALSTGTVFWQSIDLTKDYMVASTNRTDFECYIFELHDDDRPDLTLALQQRYRLYLQLPKIHRVAISPDSKWFVCVLDNERDSSLPASLRYAPVKEVVDAAKLRPSNWQDDILSAGPDPTAAINWRTVELASPVSDVTHLTVSSRNNVHTVIQPYVQAEATAQHIMMNSLALGPGGSLKTIRFTTKALEYTTVGLFTCYAPFRTKDACALVTRQNCFQVQHFTEDIEDNDILQYFRDYRLLRLVLDLDDRHAFALGITSANNNVWLLRFLIPTRNDQPIKFEQVKKKPLQGLRYNDDCKLSVAEDEEGKAIIITAPRGLILRERLQ